MKAALAAVAVALVAGSADPIVVTRDSLDLPAGCSPREVAQTIVRFFDAYNRRDLRALDRMFAPPGSDPPTFRWYTTQSARIFDRRRLVAHFASRTDELLLRGVDMGKSWVPRSVGFGFRAVRQGRRVHGKGELHCPSKRFYVWSEGPDPEATWATSGAIAAEARAGRKPNAQEISPDYRLGTTPLRLPGRCRPAAVQRLALTMLRAFNVGDGRAFARRLTAKEFNPYGQFIPRSEISAFVARSYAAGEGWSAIGVDPPTGTAGLPSWAVYLIRLSHGAGVKLVVDCRAGLATRWVGPAVRPPG